ncbi:MAG: hypothetical protein N2B04_04495 [Psychrobacter sp.]
MSNLLINEPPLQVLPSLAKVIGLNEAIMLQQVHYWLHHARVKHDGRMWIYKTLDQWREQDFSFWSLDTIKRTISSLRKMKLLLVEKLSNNSFNRVNHYTIDYQTLNKLELKNHQSPVVVDKGNMHQSTSAESTEHECNMHQSDKGNMHQCLRDNKETNKENIYTNDSQNEDVISVMNKNAQSILDWQAPSKNEMQAELIRAGSTLQMTDDQYQIYVGDFKAHFEQNALKGNPLLGDRNRKNRLRQWLENIAKKQPKQSNVFQGANNANTQPANGQHQQFDTSTTAGYAAKLDADADAYYAEQAAIAQQAAYGSTENAF